MINMGNVRFENTYQTLLEAQETMNNHYAMRDISESEKEYLAKLLLLCKEISEEFFKDNNND